MTRFRPFILLLLALAFYSCEMSRQRIIVSGIEERQANVIVVFLDSRGIKAIKEKLSTGPTMGAETITPKYSVSVDETKAIEAMAILNSNGLPHQRGTDLLKLFEKSGMMTTDKEETIRYQAGLASQITNMILMIDGVIDATVQISFPEDAALGEEQKGFVTAAVFVKHQGIFDDPNSHLETKIKRLVSGSIQSLDINNVTVVSDRSRFTDIAPSMLAEPIGKRQTGMVRVWSMVMSEGSVATFRMVFFILLTILILLALGLGFLVWKLYPVLKGEGEHRWKKLFNMIPFLKKKTSIESTEESV